DDPFVSTLMRSDHINSVREQVLLDIRSGKLTAESDAADYDRVISNNPWVLINDGVNLLSSMMTGTIPDAVLGGQNLPESFLGSYLIDVHAGEPQPDGGVPVTYVINNDTTIDSGTRIPGTGGGHLPIIHDGMTTARAQDGDWAPQHQTIVWTETVYP
ncbi:MAG: hypothetical protein ACTH8F_13375, partial [Microbacterium sp.]|uniref:hypothetical protein n=1 Tax=Microbacterium sp. TaxID=51671 RepID=UPI003F961C32